VETRLIDLIPSYQEVLIEGSFEGALQQHRCFVSVLQR